MRDFSIDMQAEKIHSAKSKDYFNEVIKSYYGESYRSAVVMLYSIAVADLIYKLEDLKDLYDDQSAKEILEEIEKMQRKNGNSPEWESKLIDLVKEKTNLMEPADYLNLVTLQKHRHLSAHPVLTQNFELYSPNKETARAHIRNILEGILTKPPILSRKIFEDFVNNLSSIKAIIHDRAQLEKHLEAKYLRNINIAVVKHIFRSLWKITFKLNNTQAKDNREINLKALIILLNRNYNELKESISKEKEYYSDIDVENNLTYVIELLNEFSELFALLNESVTILMTNIIKKDADLVTYSVFLQPDIKKHIAEVLLINWNSPYENTDIGASSIIATFEYALAIEEKDLAFDFLIQMFAKSNQFVVADERFDYLISPHLQQFTKEQLLKLVQAINGNGQIYGRRKARQTNQSVKDQVDIQYSGIFDYTPFENFTDNLSH